METDRLRVQERKHLDRAKPPSGTEDSSNILTLEKILQGLGPLFLFPRQVTLAIQDPLSQFDVKARLPKNLDAGTKLLVID